MKKFNEFEIIRINDNEIFIITKTYEDFLEFYKKLEKKLSKISFSGIFYVDQFSVLNNANNRFAKLNFNDFNFDFNSTKHMDLGEKYRKITSNFFYKNQELLDNTLIYSEFKKKILNNEIV